VLYVWQTIYLIGETEEFIENIFSRTIILSGRVHKSYSLGENEQMDREEIARLTKDYGAGWGMGHAQRILRLTSIIADGLDYDREAIWIAAHMHDWGGWPHWAIPGIDHAVRSTTVAEEYLSQNDCPMELKNRVLECIEFHHGGDEHRSFESKLFTDADALDLLGAMGTIRIFSMNPRDLQGGYQAVEMWRIKCMNAIRLEGSKRIAARRLETMDQVLRMFEEESFGYF